MITNNDETAYKKKEMIVDFRKQQREPPHIHIEGTAVEKVESFKFLGLHITDKLKWSTHTDSVVKKAQQPSHCLLTLLPFRRRGQYRCIKAGTERLKTASISRPSDC